MASRRKEQREEGERRRKWKKRRGRRVQGRWRCDRRTRKKKKRTGVDQRIRPTNTPQAKIGRKPTRGTSFLLQFSTPLSHSLSPCRLSQRGINEPFPGKGKTRWPLPAMKRRRSESFVFKKALDRRDLSWTVLRARRPCRPPRPLPFLARPKFRLRFFFGVGGGGGILLFAWRFLTY